MENPNPNDKTKYTTSRGYVITFKSIPTLLQKLAAQFPAPQVPTYEVKTATGGVEVHAHDETTLETEADKSAWAAYQLAVRAHAVEMARAQMRLMLMEGIQILERPLSQQDWEKRQTFIGFQIPADPLEREMHFLETEISADAEDILAIMAGVSRASGVDEEAVLSLEDGFRRAMGRKQGDAATGSDSANSTDEKGMEHVGAVRANGYGDRQDGTQAVMVGRAGTGRQKRDHRVLPNARPHGNV